MVGRSEISEDRHSDSFQGHALRLTMERANLHRQVERIRRIDMAFQSCPMARGWMVPRFHHQILDAAPALLFASNHTPMIHDIFIFEDDDAAPNEQSCCGRPRMVSDSQI